MNMKCFLGKLIYNLVGKNMPLLQLIWNLPFLLSGYLIKAVFFGKKRKNCNFNF